MKSLKIIIFTLLLCTFSVGVSHAQLGGKTGCEGFNGYEPKTEAGAFRCMTCCTSGACIDDGDKFVCFSPGSGDTGGGSGCSKFNGVRYASQKLCIDNGCSNAGGTCFFDVNIASAEKWVCKCGGTGGSGGNTGGGSNPGAPGGGGSLGGSDSGGGLILK